MTLSFTRNVLEACLCLLLKNGGIGLGGVAILELIGEWMFPSRQCYARRLFILQFQGL